MYIKWPHIDVFAVSRCCIFRNNVGINCTAGTNKDDLECPMQLKARFADGTLEVLAELAMSD